MLQHGREGKSRHKIAKEINFVAPKLFFAALSEEG